MKARLGSEVRERYAGGELGDAVEKGKFKKVVAIVERRIENSSCVVERQTPGQYFFHDLGGGMSRHGMRGWRTHPGEEGALSGKVDLGFDADRDVDTFAFRDGEALSLGLSGIAGRRMTRDEV